VRAQNKRTQGPISKVPGGATSSRHRPSPSTQCSDKRRMHTCVDMHACSPHFSSSSPPLPPTHAYATHMHAHTRHSTRTAHHTHVVCVVEDGAQRLKMGGGALPHLGALLGGKVEHAQEGLVPLLACASALRVAVIGGLFYFRVRLDQGTLLRGDEVCRECLVMCTWVVPWAAAAARQHTARQHSLAQARPGQHKSTALCIPHLHEQLPLALQLCQHIPVGMGARGWHRMRTHAIPT